MFRAEVGVVSLNSAMPHVFVLCKESTTSTQARTRFSRMGLGTNKRNFPDNLTHYPVNCNLALRNPSVYDY